MQALVFVKETSFNTPLLTFQRKFSYIPYAALPTELSDLNFGLSVTSHFRDELDALGYAPFHSQAV